jgi:DNA-binding NarL/FixJ family response regulator
LAHDAYLRLMAPYTDRHPVPLSIRVMIVDGHGMLRDGLSLLLERHERMKVVCTATNGRDAVALTVLHKPDVVVMDVVLPELSGIDATLRILDALPQTRVVILSACDTSEHVFRALRAGAQGYVLKESAGAELVRAILAVCTGERYLGSRITGIVIDGLLGSAAAASPLERLSAREREVLHLTVAGSSSAEIAQRLSLSRKTVDTYRSRIMTKLCVPDLVSLIHFAVAHAMTPVHSIAAARCP